MREGSVNCCREDPKLRDIDHHEHNQPRLPHCGLPCPGLPVIKSFRIAAHCYECTFGVEGVLPMAQISPSRVSTSITSRARGGGP